MSASGWVYEITISRTIGRGNFHIYLCHMRALATGGNIIVPTGFEACQTGVGV